MDLYLYIGPWGYRCGHQMTDVFEGVEGVYCNAVLQVMHLAP